MKTIILSFLLLVSATLSSQQLNYKTKQNYSTWPKLVTSFSDDFFQTTEAVRIADNVLLYQLNTGGWPKNIFVPAELTAEQKAFVLEAKKNKNDGTIDNSATTTEIVYLARLYQTHPEARYRKAILHALDYLFEAQYPCGGWPQCYPRKDSYVYEIEYNDDSNVHVLRLMRELYSSSRYSFLPSSYHEKARIAFEKGIDCILKTQIRYNGKLTSWCAQYNPFTLQPAKARAYELVSLSGQESVGIVLLLMSIEHPSPMVVEAVEAAIAWLEEVKIEHLYKETYVNSNGESDYKMVPCEDCPPLWARFYEIETNRPFFCDRDGSKRYNLSEIGHERRTGYSWYSSNALQALKIYPIWKANLLGMK